MPKVTWGRNVSREMNTAAWLDEFTEAVESRRRKCHPSYEEIAKAAGITRMTFSSKMKSGSFSLEEFSGIAKFMKFPDDLVLHLVKTRRDTKT